MIVKEKDGYYVKSEKGKNLGGPYKTKHEAHVRLGQVEYFKHKGESMNNFDATLTELKEGYIDDFRKERIELGEKPTLTKAEALRWFKCKEDDLIYSDGKIKGKGVWINDKTGKYVEATETPKEMLGKFSKKRI